MENKPRVLPASCRMAQMKSVPQPLRKAIAGALGNNRWPILISGPAGVGKSCAAALLYRQREGFSVWVETSPTLRRIAQIHAGATDEIRWIKEDGREDYVTKWQWMSFMRNAALVVWDDIGLREASDGQWDVFMECLEARAGKPTVYTTNVSLENLASVFDERIRSRLLSGVTICADGLKDLRIQGAELIKLK